MDNKDFNKRSLTNSEVNKLILDIIEIEKNFLRFSDGNISDDKLNYLIHNRQRLRRSFVVNYDVDSLYSIYTKLCDYGVKNSFDVSFFSNFFRHSLYSHIENECFFAYVDSSFVNTYYNISKDLASNCNFYLRYPLTGNIGYFDKELEKIDQFNKRVVSSCSIDEVRSLVHKLKKEKSNSFGLDYIVDGMTELIEDKVVRDYFSNNKKKVNRK